MVFETLKWVGGIDGYLELIDQRKLPGEFVKIRCRNIVQLCEAIKTLAIRGAPAIGVSAGYGLCLAMQKLKASANPDEAISHLKKSAEFLAKSRPTAVNLFWALERVTKCADKFAAENKNAAPVELRETILAEAQAIYKEDIEMCERIGRNGEKFIKTGDSILTHCNAGALATAGEGTALAVLFEAHKAGKRFRVYADETRPLLQGARLTCWELKQAGIDVTLICDNTAGWLMKQGKINAVITGADRIAANGDVANKIGTFSLSILAKEHKIPFYIAAPSSTFDLQIENGGLIPIEQRPAREVRSFGTVEISPAAVEVYNPAFDVTDAQHITAIITEKGVIERPDRDKIREHLRK
jgi:methylthioribose-1-phosphate isomerase